MKPLLTLAVLTAVALAGCGQDSGSPPPPASRIGQITGIDECDRFITRYQVCLESVPPEARTGMSTALATWRATWETMARSPTTRHNLPQMCARTAAEAWPTAARHGCEP